MLVRTDFATVLHPVFCCLDLTGRQRESAPMQLVLVYGIKICVL